MQGEGHFPVLVYTTSINDTLSRGVRMEKLDIQPVTDAHANQINQGVQWLLTALIVVASIGIFVFFVTFSGVNSNDRASFADMITGEANRPFVTRVLVPWLTRGIAAVLPESIHAGAETLLDSGGLIGKLLTEYVTPPGFVAGSHHQPGTATDQRVGVRFRLSQVVPNRF